MNERIAARPGRTGNRALRVLWLALAVLLALKWLFDLLIDVRGGELVVIHVDRMTPSLAAILLQFPAQIAIGVLLYVLVDAQARRQAASRLGVAPRIVLTGLAGLWCLILLAPSYVLDNLGPGEMGIETVYHLLARSLVAAALGLVLGLLRRA